jgi:hypothetical protein
MRQGVNAVYENNLCSWNYVIYMNMPYGENKEFFCNTKADGAYGTLHALGSKT